MFHRLFFTMMLAAVAISPLHATVHYIPHIATSSAWETSLIVDNLSTLESCQFQLTLYDDTGTIIVDHQSYTVSASQRLVVPLGGGSATNGFVDCPSQAMRFRLAFIASDASGGGTAEFDLPQTRVRTAVCSPSTYYSQLTWSGFALCNATDTDVSVQAIALTSSGTVSLPMTIPAHTRKVDFFDHLFGVDLAAITSVVFEADTDALTGIAISGNENEKLLFTQAMTYRRGWERVDVDNGQLVVGIGTVNDAVLALCMDYSWSTVTPYLSAYRLSDGIQLYRQTTGFQNTRMLSMVTDDDHDVALVSGVDLSDTNNPVFFVSRVNPATGETLWRTTVANAGEQLYSPLMFPPRMATDGTETALCMVQDKDGNMVASHLNLETGTINLTYSYTSAPMVPTTVLYDADTDRYFAICSVLNTTTETYDSVAFYDILPQGGTGGALMNMASVLIPDGISHRHVFVYGGAIQNGVMRLIYNIGVGMNPLWGGFPSTPSQYLIGSVSLSSFTPQDADHQLTDLTGHVSDRVVILPYGTDNAIAFCSNMASSNRHTFVISFSDYARTLPMRLYDAGWVTTYAGPMLTIGYTRSQPYDPSVNLKRKGTSYVVYPDEESHIALTRFVDLMNAF